MLAHLFQSHYGYDELDNCLGGCQIFKEVTVDVPIVPGMYFGWFDNSHLDSDSWTVKRVHWNNPHKTYHIELETARWPWSIEEDVANLINEFGWELIDFHEYEVLSSCDEAKEIFGPEDCLALVQFRGKFQWLDEFGLDVMKKTKREFEIIENYISV